MPDLVALDIPGGVEFVNALERIWDNGDAAAPLDPRLSPASTRSLIATLRPSSVVTRDSTLTKLPDGVPVENGDALVMATSGSSGEPKGVILTHQAIESSAQATNKRLKVDPSRHSWLACLPLSHVGGLGVVTRAMLSGTPLTVLDGFDANEVETIARSGHATHTSLVATALRRVDPLLFECILLGGAAPPNELAPNVVTTYGMTETASGLVYDSVPLDGVEVAIGTGAPGCGASGEILIRAPMLFRAYRSFRSDRTDRVDLDSDIENAKTMRIGGPDGLGNWFPTGDAGSLDAHGHLHVYGRIAEVIVTGGEKVWPIAVERVISGCAGVREVAVWKRKDVEWGERVVAWVVAQEGVSLRLDSLREQVADAIAPWAAPKELVIVESLPRSPLGKVLRKHLI